jgi:FixJ family two-component response regulator
MTACEDPQMRLRCIEAGAAGFLRKPLDRVALIDVIEYAVQRRRIMASHEPRHSHG